MQHQVTVKGLLEELRERLKLRVIAGEAGLDRLVYDTKRHKAGYIIAGPLSYIHPTPLQIIGPQEKKFLRTLSTKEFKQALERLLATEPAAILLTNRLKPPPMLKETLEKASIPLLATIVPDSQVLDNLQYYAARLLAARATLHGVFLEVLGMGVLLTGHSAAGKSELALELITRGHRLVADDAPEFRRVAPDIVAGGCPPLLRDLLEVRGLGILDIRAMFGDSAISNEINLQLIIQLKRMKQKQIADMDRLQAAADTREVLGVEIPQVTVPVAPGRNLAILVETAVRNHLLRLKGYDASEIFIERQRQAIEEASS